MSLPARLLPHRKRSDSHSVSALPSPPSPISLILILRFKDKRNLHIFSVVFLVLDNNIPPILNPTEVTHLFSMSLTSFLQEHPSQISSWHFGISNLIKSAQYPEMPPPPVIDYGKGEGRVGGKEGNYYQWRDVPWGQGAVRFHRFLTGREAAGIKPVYGLTA